MTPRLRRAVLAIPIVAGGAWQRPASAGTDFDDPKLADFKATSEKKQTKLFPLPLYATSPSEGSTFGVLPVFLRIDGTGRTSSIIAPSVSWNSAAGVNGTLRYYSFPSATQAWLLILSASTHVNRSLRLEYRDVPGEVGRPTLEIQTIARRNIFYRFFGFGPNTVHADQSSYTRALAVMSVRAGVNVLPHLNVGVRGGVRGDWTDEGAVFGLPPTQTLYAGTPGLGHAALATAELSVRYDTRQRGDFSSEGFASELHAARDYGFAGGVSVSRLTWHTRALARETSFLTGAAHFYWTDESGGSNVPFYYRSMLGGDTLFRAFTQDRFIDRGAWAAELEQRFMVFRTTWFGAVTDWRIDPYVAVGQVFPDYARVLSHVRQAAGVGFRAFVYPNIVGRVDVSYSSDGPAAYVLMGYPY